MACVFCCLQTLKVNLCFVYTRSPRHIFCICFCFENNVKYSRNSINNIERGCRRVVVDFFKFLNLSQKYYSQQRAQLFLRYRLVERPKLLNSSPPRISGVFVVFIRDFRKIKVKQSIYYGLYCLLSYYYCFLILYYSKWDPRGAARIIFLILVVNLFVVFLDRRVFTCSSYHLLLFTFFSKKYFIYTKLYYVGFE